MYMYSGCVIVILPVFVSLFGFWLWDSVVYPEQEDKDY